MSEYLSELENCNLCEWQCGANRLNGESGICRLEKPKVASAMLHPAPPKSYTIFMAGCNYTCLNCQNWSIAHYPDSGKSIRGFIEPKKLGQEAYNSVNSPEGNRMGADRIFFSGGSPTSSLPYIEKVVKEARKKREIKINYDTNGFLTINSLKRVLDFTNSITFDIKAYHENTHQALTGAPVQPVLRNAKYLAENAKEKIWEFRILLIPKISEKEIKPLTKFLSKIDPTLPVNFLAFRPNFVLEDHPWASEELMKKAIEIAKEQGLQNVNWSGHTSLLRKRQKKAGGKYEWKGAKLAQEIAENAGCVSHPRNCGSCKLDQNCPIKNYHPTNKLV